MTSDNWARLRVAILIFVMVNAVVFGVGLVIVLTMPALSQHAFLWIPIVVVSSFVVSAAAGMAHRPDDDAAVHSSAEYSLTRCVAALEAECSLSAFTVPLTPTPSVAIILAGSSSDRRQPAASVENDPNRTSCRNPPDRSVLI